MERFYAQTKLTILAIGLVVAMTFTVGVDNAAAAPYSTGVVARLQTAQPLVAYNIDYGMDLARVERTIEHYGEKIRDVVEQALRNNENHPESKDTARNSYRRESALNDVLPERRNSAFSKNDLSNLRQTEHPRDRLK